MKIILPIRIMVVLLCLFVLPVQAQDAKYRANDEKSMRIVPDQPGEYFYSDYHLKHSIGYKKAKTKNIIGKWEFIGTPNTTIEFKCDSLDQTFHFYDSVVESGTNGKWTESYNNDILMITLRHLEADVKEKLAVKRVNRRKLAIGSVLNGEFIPRSLIKKLY